MNIQPRRTRNINTCINKVDESADRRIVVQDHIVGQFDDYLPRKLAHQRRSSSGSITTAENRIENKELTDSIDMLLACILSEE
eukprot:scaffold2253_cov286-Chaetoceros_neogracile.AAC.12